MLFNGYIKLYRSLLDWEWYDDINTARLFLHLLLTANFGDAQWQGRTIKRGQRVASWAKLAAETSLTENEIRTSLCKLTDTGEITNQTTPNYSVITLVNYEKYQLTTNEPPAKPPAKPPTINQRLTTKEEEKEEKEIKKEIEGAQEWKDFLQMRVKIKKPLTHRAEQMALAELEKLSPADIEGQKAILNQSTYHCWQGLFAIMERGAKGERIGKGKDPQPISGVVRL